VENTGKAVVAEFVATFALIFIGAGSVIANANGSLDLTGVALAHGWCSPSWSRSPRTCPAAS
jgi:glycerol uptake facilitator-like aquaporin